MLSIAIRQLNKACQSTTGGVARIWIFDPEDFNFTQAAPNVNTGPQPYTAVERRTFGSGATATAEIGLSLLNITIGSGGTGYTTAPTVVITGDGSGAEAIATVSGGVVTEIELTQPGVGYTEAPTISFTGGGGTGATATASLLLGSGLINSIAVTNGGSGYSYTPTVTITGDGTGATATATVVNGVVTAINIVAHGTGFTNTPTITVNPSGATATGGAKMFPIGFSKNGNEAEYTYSQSRNGSSVKYEHQLEFFVSDLDQLIAQWNQSIDDAGACGGIGLAVQLNSGKIFIGGEKWINDDPIDIPLLFRQDGSTGTSGKLYDDPNGQTTIIKGDYKRNLYEFTGGLATLVGFE
jgi:hypothetical protein